MKLTIQNCRFGFKCEMAWDDLEPTKSKNVKTCLSCVNAVIYCATDGELAEAVRKGQCVAINRQVDNRIEPLLGVIDPPNAINLSQDDDT